MAERPFRILVVEDEPSIRELLVALCAERGVEAIAVADAASALAAAREGRPDLALLDIVLPGELDGIGLCRLLKEDERTRSLPVYMLSARVRDADREAALRAGADGYLEKPFRAAALLALIERHRGPDA